MATAAKEVFKQFLQIILWIFISCSLAAIAGGSIYGLIHLMHLKRTNLRRFLIGLIIIGIAIVVALFVAMIVAGLCRAFLSTFNSRILIVAIPLTLVYCGARAFILVESFISIRSLPLGAYETFSWENFWPHI